MLRDFIRKLRRDSPDSVLLAQVDAVLKSQSALLQNAETRIQQQHYMLRLYQDKIAASHRDHVEITRLWEEEIARLRAQEDGSAWRIVALQRWCAANDISPSEADLERVMEC